MKGDINKEVLESLYMQQKLSINQISVMCHSSVGKVHKLMKIYNIPRRTSREGRMLNPPNIVYKRGKESRWHQEGNPSWQGGLTPLNSLIRNLAQYQDWKISCLRRDNRMCQMCGAKSPLEIDHIVPFAVIVRRNQIKSIEDAEKCTELWDTTNGRTLCKFCHKNTDTYLCGTIRILRKAKENAWR